MFWLALSAEVHQALEKCHQQKSIDWEQELLGLRVCECTNISKKDTGSSLQKLVQREYERNGERLVK